MATNETKISHEGSELDYWEPLRLGPRHKTVLALKASGLSGREIASVTGYGEAWVSVIINHPDAQPLLAQLTTDHVAEIATDVRSMIIGAAREAHLKVIDLMRNAKSERVQQLSAFDVLDRAGFKPKEVIQHEKIDLGDKGAQEIADALRETRADFAELPQLATSDGVFAKRGEAGSPAPDFETLETDEPVP